MSTKEPDYQKMQNNNVRSGNRSYRSSKKRTFLMLGFFERLAFLRFINLMAQSASEWSGQFISGNIIAVGFSRIQ